MSALAALEASARLQSFTAAADELHLTQSAVSRQIRGLEEQLGAELFVRERQTVRPTAAGVTYANEVRRALMMIATATLGFRANPHGGTLNLAILPTFGTRWLAPRLPQFLQMHPGVTVNLSTRLAPFDFSREHFDAAIHHGTADWPGAKVDFLMHESVVPACSRGLKSQFKLSRAEHLLQVPLIHIVSRPDAWQSWLRTEGVAFDEVQGMLVDQFAVAAQAAVAGLGVALLPTFLIEAELARGELVAAVKRPLQSSGAYYLASPSEREGYPPLEAFRQWMRAETERLSAN